MRTGPGLRSSGVYTMTITSMTVREWESELQDKLKDSGYNPDGTYS